MTDDTGREVPDEVSRITREVTARAIRRLSILEVVITVTAVALALVAGGVLAFMFQMSLGWPFRSTWAGASLLLFVIPAVLAWLKERRS